MLVIQSKKKTNKKSKTKTKSNKQTKNTDYVMEILDIKCKYFTKADYKKFKNYKFDLKIKQKTSVDLQLVDL